MQRYCIRVVLRVQYLKTVKILLKKLQQTKVPYNLILYNVYYHNQQHYEEANDVYSC